VEPLPKYYRTRISTDPDRGLIQFLIAESAGRSLHEARQNVSQVDFLKAGREVPQSIEIAELTEIDQHTFERTRGKQIPSEEISGMSFYWMR
jgi:hypothetical protein